MNIPATLSITTAVVGLLFSALTLAVSRGPGWRELRWYTLAALSAGLFSASEAVASLPVSGAAAAWSSRIGLLLTGIHGAAWYLYGASKEKRSLRSYEKVIVALGFVLGLSALVPGLVVSDAISVRSVHWLGVTYQDGVPTDFAPVVYGFDVAAVVWLIVRYARKVARKEAYALPHVVGLSMLVLAGAHDSVVAYLELPSPYLVGVGCMSAIICIGGAIAKRFIEQSRQLARASSDLQRAQEELVRQERLAALGELAAVVAHEVRNPVGVIYNATATLQRQPLNSSGRALVEIVEEEAKRLNRIIDDLLSFTRPSSPARATVDLSELLDAAASAAVDAHPDKPAGLKMSIEQGLEVDGDERLLRHAFINVITNALQASPMGRVSIEARREGADLLIAIEDDGPGVPDELRDRIFAPFFTTRATGTGLGLSIVQRAVEDHGGAVSVVPAPRGTGARFELRLPQRAELANAPVSTLA